jgi:hypothetical protein
MKGLPISMVRKIPEDFRFVRSLGLNGVVDNVSLAPANLLWFNNRLNFYVYAQAAWNPDLDVEAVVADFIQHYYGPAAEPMAKFWKLMEEATTKFGMDPDFMPEDQALADPNVVHGWMMDVRYLIPNRPVFDQARGYLREALSCVASAHGEPLKPEYTPYVFRVQALESAIASWSPPPRDYEVFGFFNGGGQNTDHLYTDEGSVHGPVHCSVVSGNNRGDCFWVKPLGTEQLARVGDSVQVEVRINYGTEVVGEPLYRSGPGLYQAHEQTSPCGAPGAYSLMFFLSNLDHDPSGPCRVLALECQGRYETALKSSADNVWTYGQAVTLRIDYLSDAGGHHTYRYSYHAGAGWAELGTFDFPVKLPFVAPMHKWGGYYNGARTRYPVLNWATFDHFMVRDER